MPHIDVKMFPGRSDEVKKAFAEKLIETASEALGCAAEVLSVSIEEVRPENWNEQVAERVDDESIYAGKLYHAD